MSHAVVECCFIALFLIKFNYLNSKSKSWFLRMPMIAIPLAIGLKHNSWVFTRSTSNQTFTLHLCYRYDWRRNVTCISTLKTRWSTERMRRFVTFFSFSQYCIQRYFILLMERMQNMSRFFQDCIFHFYRIKQLTYQKYDVKIWLLVIILRYR